MLPTDIYRRSGGYRLEELEDEALIFSPDTGKVVYLNPSASLVWQLLDGRRSVGEAEDLLRDAYPDATESIADDLRHALRTLLEQEAIELA